MSILDTLRERKKTHGEYELNAQITERLQQALYATLPTLSAPQTYALNMICGKLARIVSGDPNFADHWVDIAGYATLVADGLEERKDQ